jgi:hypothetical protein
MPVGSWSPAAYRWASPPSPTSSHATSGLPPPACSGVLGCSGSGLALTHRARFKSADVALQDPRDVRRVNRSGVIAERWRTSAWVAPHTWECGHPASPVSLWPARCRKADRRPSDRRPSPVQDSPQPRHDRRRDGGTAVRVLPYAGLLGVRSCTDTSCAFQIS